MSASCKHCGADCGVVTPEDRERYDAEVVAAFALWARTPAYERADDAVSRQLARAAAYAELCLAADRGLCLLCLESARS